ncbi:uncharacterized protein LOC135393096 [Ornithodoros turicata]|uniref:uncharacterized protein LOC135393096 n=1 Tax=Ornithodoros turicata TaxID=34597 RepID=UPI003139D2AD
MLWQMHLHREDKVLDADCAVCELHFESHFIIRDYVHVINGTEVRIPRGKPVLAMDAVPTILPNLPAYLTKRIYTPRAPPKRRQLNPDDNNSRKRRRTGDVPTPLQDTDCDPTNAASEDICVSTVVASLSELRKLSLPSKYWVLHEFHDFPGAVYVACRLDCSTLQLVIERSVFFKPSSQDKCCECEMFLLDKLVEKTSVVTAQEVVDLLRRAAEIPLCCGAAEFSLLSSCQVTKGLQAQLCTKAGTFFSVSCTGKSPRQGLPCIRCKYLRKALQTRKSLLKEKKARRSAPDRLRASNRKLRKLTSNVGKLRTSISEMMKSTANCSETLLQQKLQGLAPKQQLAVKQCFEAAKRKSTRGMEYDKEWMLKCILLKMRSPKL